ncbi:saccharopine dehydrogenase NADP-binding domain-containing protein [Bacteroides sp.]
MKLIIAGRVAEKLAPIANELNLEYRASGVKDAEEHLLDVTVLLNCAGPFSATVETLAKTCLAQKVHYLDITGEIDVLKNAMRWMRKLKDNT